MKRIPTMLAAVAVATAVLFISTQSVLAATPQCYYPNYGVWYRHTYTAGTYDGIRGNEGPFEAATTAEWYQAVAHPMQLDVQSGDFIGWGTYHGEGTHDSHATHNCPDDDSGWNVYVDGLSNGTYFCYAGIGTIHNGDTAQYFNVNWGSCSGSNSFRVFLNGTKEWCVDVNGTNSNVVDWSVGGEARDTNNPPINANTLHINLEYYDLEQRLRSNATWYPIGSAVDAPCIDYGYALSPRPPYDDVYPHE